jgi:hypothetical protein
MGAMSLAQAISGCPKLFSAGNGLQRRPLALATRTHPWLRLGGVYKGRRATINPAEVKQMKADGMGPSAIAKHLTANVVATGYGS